jgi:uncharacterized protein YdeI (YjbR/CyaY-like superfamily)
MNKKILIPPELSAALQKDPVTHANFEAMPPSHQAEYARYVDEAKKPETRQRRSIKVFQMIKTLKKL